MDNKHRCGDFGGEHDLALLRGTVLDKYCSYFATLPKPVASVERPT